jgi:hypothetical protein
MTNSPDFLSQSDLAHLRQLLSQNQLAQAYDELSLRGYQYATLANGVVKGNSFSGRIALEFLGKTAEAQARPLSEAKLAAIRLDMANAYLDTLGLQLNSPMTQISRDISADEAWKFHTAVFQYQGLGPDAWTLNLPFMLMDIDARQVYWESVLNSAGIFEKEVLLGLVTDLIMKQAAVDPFDPVGVEDAWNWLHRLHNLETYQIALQITRSHVDQLATFIITTLADELHNGLDALTIRSILEHLDQILLVKSFKQELLFLQKQLTQPINLYR